MLNEMIVAAVTPFSGTSTPDKNGKYPVMLQIIAGKCPNRQVLSGTVAERADIEVNKTYLMQVRESGTDKQFGTDFTFVKIKELTTGADIVEACKNLGKPEIETVLRPAGFEESYTRKTTAVEGNRTKRIREGLYEPAYSRTVDHSTAPEIIDGSSVEPTILSQSETERLFGKGETSSKE